jgi:hypothetical protein
MVEKNRLTIPILEGIEQSVGCPLCYLWLKTEKSHMEHLLTNEVVMDPEFRQKVVLAKGFCNHHMHLLYKTAYKPGVLDGLGYALYARDVVESVIEQLELFHLKGIDKLESMATRRIYWKRDRKHVVAQLLNIVRRAVLRKLPCPACEHLSSLDEIYLHTYLEMMNDDSVWKDFRLSKRGLCVPHFEAAVRMLDSGKLGASAKIAVLVFELEIELFQSIAHHLSEFIRKQSWDARNEPRGTEGEANNMSLNLLVGAQGLYMGRKYDENQM